MKLKNTDEKINKKTIYRNLLGLGVSVILGIFAMTGCGNTDAKSIPPEINQTDGQEQEYSQDGADFEDSAAEDALIVNTDIADVDTEATPAPEESELAPQEQETNEVESNGEINPANFEIVPEWSVEEKMELAERLLAAFRRDGSDVIVHYIGDQNTKYDDKGNVYIAADPYTCIISYSKDRNGDGKFETGESGTSGVTYSDIDVKYQQLETN